MYLKHQYKKATYQNRQFLHGFFNGSISVQFHCAIKFFTTLIYHALVLSFSFTSFFVCIMLRFLHHNDYAYNTCILIIQFEFIFVTLLYKSQLSFLILIHSIFHFSIHFPLQYRMCTTNITASFLSAFIIRLMYSAFLFPYSVPLPSA